MPHGVLCGYAVRRIALEHLLEQIKALFVKARDEVMQRLRLILFDLW